MKNIGFLTVLTVFMLVCASNAQAREKNWYDWIFTPPMPDYQKPYLYDSKIPHAHTWNDENWSPEGWTAFRGTNKGVIDDLYAAGIITDQYEEDGQPVLEVGQRFMQLSSRDQYKVAAYVDDVFGVTGASDNGFFLLYHQKTCTPIGVYSKHGLQLQ